MMKIKREVQKTLPQLIEWVWKSEKSDGKAKYFKCKEGNETKHIIYANPTGRLNLDSERFYDKNDLFTVEEEIEITEDTVIPKSLVMFEHNGNTHIEQHDSKCINEILTLDKKVKGSVTKTIHAMNDDLTLTLIWRDGELVE